MDSCGANTKTQSSGISDLMWFQIYTMHVGIYPATILRDSPTVNINVYLWQVGVMKLLWLNDTDENKHRLKVIGCLTVQESPTHLISSQIHLNSLNKIEVFNVRNKIDSSNTFWSENVERY